MTLSKTMGQLKKRNSIGRPAIAYPGDHVADIIENIYLTAQVLTAGYLFINRKIKYSKLNLSCGDKTLPKP